MLRRLLDWLDITPPKPSPPAELLIQEVGCSKRYVARWIDDELAGGWWIDDLGRYAGRIEVSWPVNTRRSRRALSRQMNSQRFGGSRSV
jgi:hypothetical protein